MHGYRCFETVLIFHYVDVSKTKSAVFQNVIFFFLYKKKKKKKKNNPHLLKYDLLLWSVKVLYVWNAIK